MPDADNKVTLWVDGRVHQGWTDVKVTLNLDHIAGSFNLTLTEDYLAGAAIQRHRVPAGAACRVDIDGQTVLTGWVDSHTPSYDAGAHSVSVAGRDRTGDLVDCAAEVKEYLDQKLEDIAARLCAPFGIRVVAAADTGDRFARFAVNTGDTVQACIERLCRQRAVMAWSDGLGNLVIGRGTLGEPVARLARGHNVLAASAADDHSKRYSVTVVRGTRETPKTKDAKAGSQSEGVAADPEITRYRPKIMTAETQGAPTTLAERAAHEQRVAKGKSRKVTTTVNGWRHGRGLWRPGQTVAFADDWLGIDGLFLLANVELSKASGGTTAKLTLVPPGAFDQLPEGK